MAANNGAQHVVWLLALMCVSAAFGIHANLAFPAV